MSHLSIHTSGPFYHYLYNQHSIAHAASGESLFIGSAGLHYARFIALLCGSYGCTAIYDYGGGQSLPLEEDNRLTCRSVICDTMKTIFGLEVNYLNSELDNGALPLQHLEAVPSEAVICTDVLEHIHRTDLPHVLNHIFSSANTIVVINISCIPAKKSHPDGRNQHVSLFHPETWVELIATFSALHDRPFALFLLTEEHNSKLVHNIPLDSAELCFQDYAFYPYSDEFRLPWINFSSLACNDLKHMNPQLRWINTHLHNYQPLPITITPSTVTPGVPLIGTGSD